MGKSKHNSERITKSPQFSEIRPGLVYSVDQFCSLVGVTQSTIGEWRRERGFPIREVGRAGMIYSDDVIGWIAKQPLRQHGA